MTAELSKSDLEPPSSDLGSSITVEISDVSGSDCDLVPLESAIRATLQSHRVFGVEVSLLLTTDEHIRSLNLQYRGLDETTDVLSFGLPSDLSDSAPKLLGDIVISVPHASRQAQVRNIPLNLELCYLAIHGALHLIGFQDETDDEREGMMREMSKMAGAAGLPADPEWSSILHSVEEAAR